MSRSTKVIVFYAGLVWREYPESVYDPFKPFKQDPLPDGAVIYVEDPPKSYGCPPKWFAANFASILPEHVPKEYLLLAYLLR